MSVAFLEEAHGPGSKSRVLKSFLGKNHKLGIDGSKSTYVNPNDYLPTDGVVQVGIFRYLPGEQLRTVVLTRKQLAFGLSPDACRDDKPEDANKMLDYIPLHEIEEIKRSDTDIEDMFNILDTDGDGLISLQELQEGLQMYGLSQTESRKFYFGQGEEDLPLDPQNTTLQYQDWRKHQSGEAGKRLQESAQHVMVLQTVEDGFNSGAKYHLLFIEDKEDVDAPEHVDEWIEQMQQAVAQAKRDYAWTARWISFQESLQKFYNHNLFQAFVGGLIVGNFVLTAYQLQIHPEEGSQTYDDFELADTVFTIVFTIELAINMLAHCWSPFWQDGWNVFDFLVVSVCLLAMFSSELDVFKSLRLIRPFRVLRLFARLASLRMLVNAISASIAPVANALAIVMIVIAIYAVLGVSFFETQDPENFATFSMAMFTMFQVSKPYNKTLLLLVVVVRHVHHVSGQQTI